MDQIISRTAAAKLLQRPFARPLSWFSSVTAIIVLLIGTLACAAPPPRRTGHTAATILQRQVSARGTSLIAENPKRPMRLATEHTSEVAKSVFMQASLGRTFARHFPLTGPE